MESVSTNAYFLGKDVLEIEKCAVFWRQGDLMNRLIPRSWGEGCVNIFLDRSIQMHGCSHAPEGSTGTLVSRGEVSRQGNSSLGGFHLA